jgi:zinc protease
VSVAGSAAEFIPPALGPNPVLRLPDVQRTRLSNGLGVMLLEHHKTPLVDFTLVCPAGSAADPVGRAGLAGLTIQMLDEGTQRYSSLELSEEVDFLGAYLAGNVGWEASFVSLSALVRHLPAALELFAQMVFAPIFPQPDWERIKKQRLDGLLSAADQPATLASWAFDLALFGPEHPYAYPASGTPATVAAVERDAVRDFHGRTFRPEGSTVIVVGDTTLERAVPLLEAALAGWTGAAVAVEPPEPPARRPGVRITVVDRPGSAQSVIRAGHVGLPRRHPDYFAARVMNMLLGGWFAGRINRNLRETKGFTYGAGSSFDFRRKPGPFAVSAAVHTKDTAAAVAEIVRELREIRGARPPTVDETTAVINFMTRGFVRHFETPRQIGDNYSAVVVHGLADDFFNTWVERISAVTAADAARAAAEHLHPDGLDVVLCGDAAAVRADLAALQPGELRVIRREEIFPA